MKHVWFFHPNGKASRQIYKIIKMGKTWIHVIPKDQKLNYKQAANDNTGSRWKGSLPTEDLSNFGEEIWEGIVPQKTQRPQRPQKTTPKVEKNFRTCIF